MPFYHALKKIGFSDKKATIYLALLKNGEMTAREIAKETGIQRTTVYDILKELIKNNFACVANSSKEKQSFKLEEPEKLKILIEEKEKFLISQKQLLEDQQKELQDLLPQLKSLSEEAIGKPKVAFYDGAKGLVEALNDCLISKQNLNIYGSLGPWQRWMSDHFSWYLGEVEKRKIDVKVIDQKTLEQLRSATEEIKTKWPIKHLPVGFNLPGFCIIYGEKVLLASFQRPMATIITNKEYAMSQKTVFDLFWQFLREE